MTNISRRNEDFCRLCDSRRRELARSGLYPSVTRVLNDVLAGPAPSFYVEFEQARPILMRALATGQLPRPRYAPCRRWQDMLTELRRLIAAKPLIPIEDQILDLCAHDYSAPSFYMTARTARRIINRQLAKAV